MQYNCGGRAYAQGQVMCNITVGGRAYAQGRG